VVSTGIVKVDRKLDETHAQDPGIEIEIALGIACDGGDVIMLMMSSG
jgi:hypothetical protein